MKMTFDEYLRRNKPVRDLRNAMMERFGIPRATIDQFAGIMFESGQHDMRFHTLNALLETDDDAPQESDAAPEGS
jgi:hypothetical protein